MSENMYNSIKTMEGRIKISLFFKSGVESNTILYDKNAAWEDQITALICNTVQTHIGGCMNITVIANGNIGVTEYPSKE